MTGRPAIRFAGSPPFPVGSEAQDIIGLADAVLDRSWAHMGIPPADAVILERLDGGRSGGWVFRVGFPNRRAAVLKISPCEKGVTERDNYDRFVRPHLPAAIRPRLLGFAQTSTCAALCYTFVGSLDAPQTLSHCLASGDRTMAAKIVSRLFDGLSAHWYAREAVEAEDDLAGYYRARYFGDPGKAAEAEATLFDHAQRYFGAARRVGGYAIGETMFPSACDALFTQHRRAYRSCILHGDLNSGNVIVGRAPVSAWLIDFQRTGRGHMLQDLVSLEASVRINFPQGESVDDILEIERRIAQGDPRVRSHGYAGAVVDIRDAARHLFTVEDADRDHGFAVAAAGLRLMRATDLGDAAQARIVASTLWAAKADRGT